jgi:hypothetical protein
MMGKGLLRSDGFILFWWGPVRSVDGYSNICHGRHLRDQGDPHSVPCNSTDGRSAHISFICHRCGLDRVIITICMAALAAGCNDFLTKSVSRMAQQQDHRVGFYQGVADVRGQPAGLCEVCVSGSGSSGAERCAPVAHARREDFSLPQSTFIAASDVCGLHSRSRVRTA